MLGTESVSSSALIRLWFPELCFAARDGKFLSNLVRAEDDRCQCVTQRQAVYKIGHFILFL